MWKERLGRYQNIGFGKTKHGVIKTTRGRVAFANAFQVSSAFPEDNCVCWFLGHDSSKDLNSLVAGRLQKVAT
jgi:hypothetical protein